MLEYIALGYTLGTGRLYVSMPEFQAFAEKLMGRPVYTHEFADENLWDEMRTRFEDNATNAFRGGDR